MFERAPPSWTFTCRLSMVTQRMVDAERRKCQDAEQRLAQAEALLAANGLALLAE